MKNIMLRPLYSLIILFSLLIPLQALADDVKEVQTAYYEWCKAAGTAKGNPKKMVKFYAEDAILLPTLSSKMLKNENGGFNEYFTNFTKIKNLKCYTDKLLTTMHHPVAINSGFYTFTFVNAEGEKEVLPARFTFIYKKVGDKWLIIKHHSSRLPDEMMGTKKDKNLEEKR